MISQSSGVQWVAGGLGFIVTSKMYMQIVKIFWEIIVLVWLRLDGGRLMRAKLVISFWRLGYEPRRRWAFFCGVVLLNRIQVPHTTFVPKVMRMIFKKFCLTYMQLQFIPFKIVSLWSKTAIPALLPLFIAEEEVFTGDVVQSPRRSCLDVFNCPKMITFELGFELGE